MSTFWNIVYIGVVAALALAVGRAIASTVLALPLELSIGAQCALYVAIGYFARQHGSLRAAAGAAALVGAVDHTIGFYISLQVAPGAAMLGILPFPLLVASVVRALVIGVICALVGAALAVFVDAPARASRVRGPRHGH